MKIALEWLRHLVPTPAAPDAIADLLTMGGLEVEDLITAPAFSQVVVARVLQVKRHPNADRLNVCQVDAGGGSDRTIVCGAPNVAPGLLVPCALPGAVLPGGFAIKVSTVRGVRSEGMLCSARELGLAEDSQGLLLLDTLAPEAAVPGTDLRLALGLDEPTFEIKTTPNRGDALSVLGVARDLSALTGVPLVAPPVAPVTVNTEERLAVRIAAPDLCGRFSGRVIRGVNARAATPAWMKRRLERCGQRPISALVDISNYVMLELGQPSHVFDLAKVHAPLEVRWARPGEKLMLLNDQEVTLDAGIGVVADRAGPEAIAGIMGGMATSVTLDTNDIYVEAAFWWPEAIQGRARRLGFATEAGHRFERGVDFAGTVRALDRLAGLIVEICGTGATRVGPIDDTLTGLPARAPVSLRESHLQRVLGIALTTAQAMDCLTRLGLPCQQTTDGLRVVPPSFRFDIEREVDLIEEVARIHGYGNIPANPPLAPARMRARPEGTRRAHDLRQDAARAGYQELVNFSFVSADVENAFGADPARIITVLNPIAAQYGVMRSNLMGGLVANLRYNVNRQAARVRTFEIGRVFARDAGQADTPTEVAGVSQPLCLAALAFGPAEAEQWGVPVRPVDFFDIKGDLERLLLPLVADFEAVTDDADPRVTGVARALHPGRRALVRLDGRAIGWIGELHPRLGKEYDLPSSPVLFEVLVEPLLVTGLPQPQDVPRFPALVRDIAVWVGSATRAGDLLADLRSLAARREELALIRSVQLFDVFRPRPENAQNTGTDASTGLLNKEKSLAFRLVLQDTARSLAEPDADSARAAIIDHLVQHWGARLR